MAPPLRYHYRAARTAPRAGPALLAGHKGEGLQLHGAPLSSSAGAAAVELPDDATGGGVACVHDGSGVALYDAAGSGECVQWLGLGDAAWGLRVLAAHPLPVAGRVAVVLASETVGAETLVALVEVAHGQVSAVRSLPAAAATVAVLPAAPAGSSLAQRGLGDGSVVAVGLVSGGVALVHLPTVAVTTGVAVAWRPGQPVSSCPVLPAGTAGAPHNFFCVVAQPGECQ